MFRLFPFAGSLLGSGRTLNRKMATRPAGLVFSIATLWVFCDPAVDNLVAVLLVARKRVAEAERWRSASCLFFCFFVFLFFVSRIQLASA